MNKLCIVKKCTMDLECPLRSRCHPKLNYCRGEWERPYNFEFILVVLNKPNPFFQIWNVKINRNVNRMNFVKKIYVSYQRANIAVITSIVVSKISVHEKMTKGILPLSTKIWTLNRKNVDSIFEFTLNWCREGKMFLAGPKPF